MLRKLLILFLLLAGCWRTGSAQQVKPVQVIPQLLQPYSIYLSDYYSQDREKMVVTLISRDLQKPVLSVRLRMSIEGQSAQLRNKAYADLPQLQLEAGVPLRLSLQDLAPYFHPNNLDFSGMNRSQYQQQGRLPEGLYSFCFEAVEVNTGQVVSQKSCATAWLSLSDPPLVNLPRKGELIPYRDPQNIIFQWTPRHLASSAFAAEYEFTLVELWDTGVAPEVAFRTAQPLYQTTTRTTTLLYGPAEPALLPGRRYGWRVRAKGGIGVETTELFRNSGYTEVHWFTYQADCPAPRQALARAESGRAEIAWMPDPTAFRYLVEYRELGNSKAEQWHKVRSSEPRAMLYELKPGRSYEYRVGSQCGTVTSEDAWAFSPLHRFDMPERGATQGLAQCNLEPRLNLTNKTQLEALQPGEVIMAGDFPVRLLRVSGQKSFTGTGYVVIPFLGETRVRVQFANIQVNTDYQLIAGVIETVYDASEGQIADVDKLFALAHQASIQISAKLAQLQELLKQPQANSQQLFDLTETLTADFEELVNMLPDLPDEERQALVDLARQLQDKTILAVDGDTDAGREALAIAVSASRELEELKSGLREKVAYSKRMAGLLAELDAAFKGEAEEYYRSEIRYKDGEGLIPKRLWQSGIIDAHAAGFIDGLAEATVSTGKAGAYTLLRLSGLAAIATPPKYMGKTPATIAAKHADEMDEALRLLIEKPELINQVYSELKKQFGVWLAETASLDKQGQYNQGKLLFEVVLALVGAEQLQLLAKTGRFSERAILRIKNGIKDMPAYAKTSIGSAREYFQKGAGRIIRAEVRDLSDLISWAKKNSLSGLTEVEIKGTLDLFEGNISLSQKALLSTKEIVSAKTLDDLAKHLNLSAKPSPQSLTPYQARVWYSWRKSNISKLVDRSKGLEAAAKEALEMRNQIRTLTREAMKDKDIADFLNLKETNMTWDQAINKYGKNYEEIIQASMRGRGIVDILYKIPK